MDVRIKHQDKNKDEGNGDGSGATAAVENYYIDSRLELNSLIWMNMQICRLICNGQWPIW
jgi:hypothetical protein